jgi:hypothetical protein
MTDDTPRCLFCERTSDQIPVLTLTYQEQAYHICPEHLPVLIHQPHRLVGLLPGAEQLTPGER